jgi:hypothetical protein
MDLFPDGSPLALDRFMKIGTLEKPITSVENLEQGTPTKIIKKIGDFDPTSVGDFDKG